MSNNSFKFTSPQTFYVVTDNTTSSPTLVNYLTGTYTVEAFASNGAWPGPDLGISAIVITYTMTETN